MNAFGYELFGHHRYDTSSSKGMVIGNPYSHVAKQLLACESFAREDSLNVPHLPEFYFLYSILEGHWINPRSFLITQICSATTNYAQGIVIRCFITPI